VAERKEDAAVQSSLIQSRAAFARLFSLAVSDLFVFLQDIQIAVARDIEKPFPAHFAFVEMRSDPLPRGGVELAVEVTDDAVEIAIHDALPCR
jgi:hypothetical protein